MLKYLLRDQIRRSSFLATALMLARADWSFVPCSATTAPERCASSGLRKVRVLGSPNPNRMPWIYSLIRVEDRFIELAVELSELRNRKLNHPGSMDVENLNEWIYKSEDPRLSGDPGHFGKGELTAMAYLEAYAARLTARDKEI